MPQVNGKLTRKLLGRYPTPSLADERVHVQEALAKMARGEIDDRPSSAMLGQVIAEWLKRDQARIQTLH
ncbi:hypothetical protein SAMN05444004_12110 [Jannaschia faecimaris]|uniref:Uncharacterized protein n=1 Tax=Jannaschia faecimaris TaxID=1244108 RepID=A0A1H3TYT5_9RHOB|nr:hypothetical protein SAMN05444004_12110 [Jannaschia faecimaris]